MPDVTPIVTPTQTPGVTNVGLIKVRNNDALAAEEKSKQDEQSPETKPVIDSLAGYLRKCWETAKQAKQPIEQQMLKNLRQRHGVYENDKLTAIRQMGGTEVYVMLTLTKCRAAEAWVNDIMRPIGERPWAINPTPIAELPQEIHDAIMQNAMAVVQEVMDQAVQLGEAHLIDPTRLQWEIKQYIEEEKDKAHQTIQGEAQARADRMADKIADQLSEGGWDSSFWEVISDVITLKAGILKGPVIRRKKVAAWKQAVNGEWVWTVEEKLVPEFERVSPFDIYPAPDSRHPDDGYLIEHHRLTRTDLIEMIGVPGYNEKNIRAAISDYGVSGNREWLAIDTERAMLEFGQTLALTNSDKIDALEFWGPVPGRFLLDWGMKGLDPELDYEVNCWLVGNYVIRAIMNPDKLGRKPYSVDSFERVPGSFWGKGIPELMNDIQDVCNAIARSIVNNAALASGPQVDVNTDRVTSDTEEIWPWKIWKGDNQALQEAPPVNFYQPQCITGPLLQVYETFAAMSDDQTGIPRWSHGATDVGGAGGTSSGLSMLMTSASRGIKEVIAHIDRITCDTIRRTYDFNMMYGDDPDMKGDCRIEARGSSAFLAKEQRIARTNEFLATTNNPTDLQIIGLKGRARLLREAAKTLEIDTNEIIPSDNELQDMIDKAQQMQAQMQQQAMLTSQPTPEMGPKGSTPPPNPRELDVAGNPAGGTDANAFPNLPQPPQGQGAIFGIK